jgi:hypothetical protein
MSATGSKHLQAQTLNVYLVERSGLRVCTLLWSADDPLADVRHGSKTPGEAKSRLGCPGLSCTAIECYRELLYGVISLRFI